MPVTIPKDKPWDIRRRNSKGQSIRIRENGWGTWKGYIGNKWVISFMHDLHAGTSDEQNAHAWLEENSK